MFIAGDQAKKLYVFEEPDRTVRLIKMSKSFRKVESVSVSLDRMKVRKTGHIIEVRQYMKVSTDMPVKKLNAESYYIVSTGEVKDYNRQSTRIDNAYELKKSMGDCRALINNNFQGHASEIWITLTYRQQTNDTEQIYLDYKNFMKRLRYHTKRDLDYIIVLEPHGSGNFHIHGLMKARDRKRLYIEQSKLMEIWRHGGVNVKRLKNGGDNVGAYISAYLSNLDEKDAHGKPNKKRERLKYYPPGMRFYRYSSGIKKPEWEWIEGPEKKKLRSGTPEYAMGIEITDENGKVLQAISYKQYNMKRTK